jgi:hypothetical protein
VQQVANAQHDLSSIQRLDQEVVGPEEKGAVPSDATCVGREDDDREEPEALTGAAETPQDLQAIYCWHVKVQ